MALDTELLDLVICPDTRDKLRLADQTILDKVNAAVRVGKARTRGGKVVEAPLEAGLVRADGKLLYAVENDVPNLLPGDGILIDLL